MDFYLAGKRVMVTGALKGIGLATALLLAEEGCNLVLVSRNAADLAEAAAAVHARRKVSVQVIPADLSQGSEIERVAEVAGPLDVLVNNAGAIPPGLSRLKERGGVVVNIIGASGEREEPNYLAGSTGNAALMAFTRALGTTAPRDGMRVVGINPGPVGTERIERLLRAKAEREFGDPSRWQEAYRAMAFGRPARPEEIADAVAFLASPRAAGHLSDA